MAELQHLLSTALPGQLRDPGPVEGRALPPELPIAADTISPEDDLHAVQDLPDSVAHQATCLSTFGGRGADISQTGYAQSSKSYIPGSQAEPDSQTLYLAQTTRPETGNANRFERASADNMYESWHANGMALPAAGTAIPASKRSLTPTAHLTADDSSADTSPEAARNSRMKMRRTSGEYQQVSFDAPLMMLFVIRLRSILQTFSFRKHRCLCGQHDISHHEQRGIISLQGNKSFQSRVCCANQVYGSL